ncbi:hypothetical protein L2E82_47190 [Cichorium intybus]|uniref:Uncharacterized protein n=1 Tax=Cichorium intybus TaxID=13427 RepID=A0ACB8YUN8_CICIN|nr:hypothetical protein L2E82_47190 [Cichorium intybus]
MDQTDDLSEASPAIQGDWNAVDDELETKMNSRERDPAQASGSQNFSHGVAPGENKKRVENQDDPLQGQNVSHGVAHGENKKRVEYQGDPLQVFPDGPHEESRSDSVGPTNTGPLDTRKKSINDTGLGCEASMELGQSVLAKSKSRSIDLNENPNSSSAGESRNWANVAMENPSPSGQSSDSINKEKSCLPTSSTNSSQEIDATMELGERIGFSFEGKKEQVEVLLKRRGAAEMHQ